MVILLKIIASKVKQLKYNFDASDPPRLHQMAPLSIQNFLTGNTPRTPYRHAHYGHSVGCLRYPDRLLLQNDLLLKIFLRRLHSARNVTMKVEEYGMLPFLGVHHVLKQRVTLSQKKRNMASPALS